MTDIDTEFLPCRRVVLAMIKRSVQDYATYPTKRQEIMEFFNSWWCEFLYESATGYDHEVLLARLEAERGIG
jgi:hypothetical protein